MRILVINLLRLGDLIQCSPVLRSLRTAYPEAHITLMAQDAFQETAFLVPGPDLVLPLPTRKIAPLLDREGAWPEAYGFLNDWLREHLEPPPDLVINLTPNFLGALLSFLCRSKEVRGLTLNAAKSFVTRPAWMTYLMVVSRARKANPFNLVDIFQLGAGLQPGGSGLAAKIPPEAHSQAEAALGGLGLSPETSLVGLLPGASQPQRCWPPEKYAQVARQLLSKRSCHFFIFGSRSEQPLGEKIARLLPPGTATLCAGGTSLAALAAMLSRLHLFISNDTGPMHLAAAVKTPVLAFFLAGAQARDTGPVGEGHISLEPRIDCHPCHYPDSCSLFQCHQALSPEAVAAWALHLLERRPSTPIPDAPRWRDLQVYLSTWDPTGHQAHLPLILRPLDRKHFWILAHRIAWSRFLHGADAVSSSLTRWLNEVLERHFLPPEDGLGVRDGQAALREMLEIASRGEELARGILKISGLRHPPAFLWQQAEAIRRIDPQLHRLGVSSPEIAAFIEFYFQEQRGQAEGDVNLLADHLSQAYSRLGQAGKICLEASAEIIRQHPVISAYLLNLEGGTNCADLSGNPDLHQIIEVAPCR
jgi:ADP-heptose:LPS heptosyltransferase